MSYIGAEPSYGVFQKQVLAGDGSTTTFSLDYNITQATQVLVSLDGIVQEPEYAYNIQLSSGTSQINFASAPTSGARIFLVYMGRQLLQAASVYAGTHIDEFNGDGSTTGFTLTRTPAAAAANNFVVFVDNVYQRYGASYAYTVSGTTITFTAAPASGTNNVQVIQLSDSNTLNTIADGTVSTAKLQDNAVTVAKTADEVFAQAEDDATALAIALG